jgi:hypothetical protein
MAATYTITAQNVAFAANKSMISIFNGSGSGKVIRVYRIWALNNQLVAVTGVLTNLEIRRITASSGGTDLASLVAKHDSTSAAIPAEVLISTNATVTPSVLYRRVIWSTDEPAANATVTMDELQTLVPLACIWSLGYADSSTDPITLREGYGVTVMNTGGATGQADFIMEFTAT